MNGIKDIKNIKINLSTFSTVVLGSLTATVLLYAFDKYLLPKIAPKLSSLSMKPVMPTIEEPIMEQE